MVDRKLTVPLNRYPPFRNRLGHSNLEGCVYRKSEHKNSAAGVKHADFDSALPRTVIMSGWLGIYHTFERPPGCIVPKAFLYPVHVGVEILSRSD